MFSNLYVVLILAFMFRADPPQPVKDGTKVEGLELTASMKGPLGGRDPVKTGEQVPSCRQLTIAAKTDEGSEVRFLVFGTAGDPDFEVAGNTISVVTPPEGGRVDVFAIASRTPTEASKSKMTEYAYFTVLGKQPVAPPVVPPVNPPTPPTVSGPVHVMVIDDQTTRSPETAALLASPTLKASLGTTKLETYDVSNTGLAARGIAIANGQLSATLGGKVVASAPLPVLLVVDSKGALHLCRTLPRTEAETLGLLKPYIGGK